MTISVLIFFNSEIIGRGLCSILENTKGFKVIGHYSDKSDLSEQLLLKKPEILILDPESLALTNEELLKFRKSFPNTRILSVTGYLKKSTFQRYLEAGVASCLLTDCGSEEIIEAIIKTNSGERFLCGKIADILLSEKESLSTEALRQSSCMGFGITERESEIIQLIATGLSNKQIADKLFLSTHTVNTHRKNILSKLGVNNTAGVVMFAVKNHLLEPNQFLFSN